MISVVMPIFELLQQVTLVILMLFLNIFKTSKISCWTFLKEKLTIACLVISFYYKVIKSLEQQSWCLNFDLNSDSAYSFTRDTAQSFLRIWLLLLKKSLTEKCIFCAMRAVEMSKLKLMTVLVKSFQKSLVPLIFWLLFSCSIIKIQAC